MRLLDRYSILDRIGSGGMATIYRATDERLQRVVCVKLLRTTLVEGSGSTSGERAVYKATYTHFLQEALALSKLQHPNTLRIFDFGYVKEDDGEQGAPFHVSEYLDGGNLESHVRLRGALPNHESIQIIEGICGAAAEAHEHDIIHRDIKPSNILFARVRGELVSKLADFGIAHSDVKKKEAAQQQARDDGFGESVSTVALFSPRWAAPEQLCGSPEGPRTDVYALGLLTIFMLTGVVLFGDEDVRVTFNDRVRGDTLVDSRIRQLKMPTEIARLLEKALLARSEDRIATATEFAQRLREAMKVKGSSIAPPVESAKPTPPTPPRPSTPESKRTMEMPAVSAPPRQPEDGGSSGSSSLPTNIQHAPIPPPPLSQSAPQVDRRLRYTQVHEKLDLSVATVDGDPVRFRVTMLPGANVTLNFKGLSCFVAKQESIRAPRSP